MGTVSTHENLPGDECKNLVENFMGSLRTHESLDNDMIYSMRSVATHEPTSWVPWVTMKPSWR